MKNIEKSMKSPAMERGQRAESLIAEIFEKAGWRVERQPKPQRSELDMIVRRPDGVVYAVEVKAAVEGRADRLLPLFSQAVLQSLHGAGQNAAPLAVVAAPKISQGAAKQILKFAEHYAPDAAAGVIDFEGLRRRAKCRAATRRAQSVKDRPKEDLLAAPRMTPPGYRHAGTGDRC